MAAALPPYPRIIPSTSPDTWEGRNLYVKHLPPVDIMTMTMPNEFHVMCLFARFGPIESVRVIRDARSGRPVGVAFVLFETAEAAAAAIQELNGYGGMTVCHWLPRAKRFCSQPPAAPPAADEPQGPAEQLFFEVINVLGEARQAFAPKVTGMLLELGDQAVSEFLASPAELQRRVDEALSLLAENAR